MWRRRRWRSSRGQILIPAAFALPSLFLFVFLIYETAKLSREKIRHQFAVDAASFVEMVNYSDFFNRTAYVDGAFPMRIFKEAYLNLCQKYKNKVGNGEGGPCGGSMDSAFRIMWQNGNFPAYVKDDSDPPDPGSLDEDPNIDLSNEPNLKAWTIKFGGPNAAAKNSATDPDFSKDRCSHIKPTLNDPCMETFTYDNVNNDYWVLWGDANTITTMYMQVYELLGQVEDAQEKVFERLTSDHVFYGKSYWLNTGDNPYAAQDGKLAFANYATVTPRAKCIGKIYFYADQLQPSIAQPYQMYAPNGPLIPPQKMSPCDPDDGLFQLEFIDPQQVNSLRSEHNGDPYAGIPIVQSWDAPSNYFKVNMNALPGTHGCEGGGGGMNSRPCVHATISTGVSLAILDPKAGVWPNPTPKFQTELFP